MLPALVVMMELLGQASPPRADPVRIWRSDSTAYVTLREPGHLLVLHVDPIGRIEVLFPLTPEGHPPVSNDAPVAVALPPSAQGNPATFIAVRSRWAFDFAALRWGSWWNYQDALLLQPTAGDPLAALLEIADRVTDGRPYDYGTAVYSRDGTIAARREPLQPDVCLGCVRRATPVATAPAPVQTVDCANASLTNSFCGVANAPVSITSAPAAQTAYQPPPAPAPVYVPYYLPVFVRHARPRFERHVPSVLPAPQRSAAAAYPIAPKRLVPSRTEWRSFDRRP